ncbi:bifunctional riboflavin kinase/FAD synthetase [Cytobacillus purgationiresistens]|uniref:Riboflavin biosynthesis protein n=1 Tax=Cytobacillus purgationiresistens TaxID=863449 RepID=A0ABU0AFZ5_9BACI|nr:bifunctional riboflavin kinase/FAD synthetase [Cytobacillus purgationiresistens]MDQ0270181.1 riboflavin kinase/FMN adenylyltransferase [Cytobacillus purgationiresistens]
MEVIKIQHPHHLNTDDLPPLSMALGFFDGVHLGHQKVMLKAKEKAQSLGLKSAVMTFDPHPSVVLGKNVGDVEYITPIKDKINFVSQLGIDYLFIIHFTKEFAHLLPQEFIDQYIIGLNVKHVTAGFDYSYGRMGKGTMDTIPEHSRNQFTYTTVPQLKKGEDKISSTLIRRYIRDGNVQGIPELLGRFYSLSGMVVQGDQRGRKLGFPTANVDSKEDYLIPPVGVYAVRIHVKGVWREAVCNLGYKPTFHDDLEKPSVEVHIFDFDQDIYGEEVIVEWHQHLRSERKFNGIDELITQISKDKGNALLYFEKNKV